MSEERIQELVVDLSIERTNERFLTGDMTSLRVVSVDDLNAGLVMKLDKSSSFGLTVNSHLSFTFGTEDGKQIFFDTLYFSNDAGIGEAKILVARNVDLTRDITISPELAIEGVRQQVVTIGNTPTKIPATPLANRKSLFKQNNSGVTIYLGGIDVSASGAKQGILLRDGDAKTTAIAENVDYYGIVASGTADLNIEELA